MSETAVHILQFTHHGPRSRNHEYKAIKRHCGYLEKIVCNSVTEGIENARLNTKLSTAAIDLIFLEFNLGKSGETTLTITPQDFELLLAAYPNAHIHFYSGGTAEMEGYEQFMQSINPEFHTQISNGVGSPKLFGIELIPAHLKRPLPTPMSMPTTSPPAPILHAIQDVIAFQEKEATLHNDKTDPQEQHSSEPNTTISNEALIRQEFALQLPSDNCASSPLVNDDTITPQSVTRPIIPIYSTNMPPEAEEEIYSRIIKPKPKRNMPLEAEEEEIPSRSTKPKPRLTRSLGNSNFFSETNKIAPIDVDADADVDVDADIQEKPSLNNGQGGAG